MFLFCVTSKQVIGIIIETFNQINAAINVMPEGGGGARDEVGTLNVLGHPRWGILANFEHKCWPRDREV